MSTLAPAQNDIMRLVSQGLSDQEIAKRRHRARSTVKGQMGAILRRLEARNRAHAVALWLAQQRVEPTHEVKILGTVGGPKKLAGDYSHGVTLLERGGRLIARCARCAVMVPITESVELVTFNELHAEHLGRAK